MAQLFWTLITYPAFSSPGKSKEAEIKRINKELANIRSKFKGRWGSCLRGRGAGGWDSWDSQV